MQPPHRCRSRPPPRALRLLHVPLLLYMRFTKNVSHRRGHTNCEPLAPARCQPASSPRPDPLVSGSGAPLSPPRVHWLPGSCVSAGSPAPAASRPEQTCLAPPHTPPGSPPIPPFSSSAFPSSRVRLSPQICARTHLIPSPRLPEAEATSSPWACSPGHEGAAASCPPSPRPTWGWGVPGTALPRTRP